MRILAWTYEADVHCCDCAGRRFGESLLDDDLPVDNEGNEVHPVFSFDDFDSDVSCVTCLNLIGVEGGSNSPGQIDAS